MVNDDGDNSIVVIPGANFELHQTDIKDEHFAGMDYLLAQLETPIETIEYAFAKAKALGLQTVLNPAPAQKLSNELISNVDLLIPNETEFELLTGFSPETKNGLDAGTALLFEQGVKALIITLGKNGALYVGSDGEKLHVNGYSVKAIDTTAAGDSFIGGLLTSLSKGESIEDAMEFAMKVGAVTVTNHGAQSSLPTLSDIESFEGVKRQ
jgi:ribokinase